MYSALPKQEKKVALYVLKHPKQVQNISIEQLGKAAEVSNATITRFVKKINHDNFYSFKLALARDSEVKQISTKNKSNIATQVQDFYKDVLLKTKKRLKETSLESTVLAIKHCRRIYVYGIGSSGYTAQELVQRLIRMGISAFDMTESHLMYMSSSLVKPDDVIIALSSSGNTIDVNEAVELAKKRGATTIAITGTQNSPLANIVDIILLGTNIHFVDNTKFINSQFAITFIIDIITNMLLKDKTLCANMNRTIELINDKKNSK